MTYHGSGWWAYFSHDEKQDQPSLNRTLLERVWIFAKPYRSKVFGLLITIIFISGLSLIPPLLFRYFIDEALPNEDIRQLNLLVLGMVMVPLINGIIGVWQRRLSAEVGEGVIFDLRRALYDHMIRMSLRFYTRTRTGELMSRLNNDVVGAQRALTSTLVTIIANIIALVSTLIVMLIIEWRLTLLGLAILPLFALPARRVARKLRVIRRRSMELNAEMNADMNETLNIGGALLVKLFGRQQHEKNKFSANAGNVRDVGVESAVVSQWFFLGLGVVGAIGTAVVYWAGGRLVLQGAFTVGTIVAFSAYLTRLYGPLISLTNAPVEFAQSMVSFERVFEALDIPVEIDERPKAIELPRANGNIIFENVTFTYESLSPEHGRGLQEVARFGWGADRQSLVKRGKQSNGDKEEGAAAEPTTPTAARPALNGISFKIDPGELVALVGPSGAGKTTITYLLPRLYDPTSGQVLLDGHDLRDLTLNSLSNNIGMVTQDTYLFYDTIRANLLYAQPGATDSEIVEAAKAANIHDFISSLPDGYYTVVGERGYRLSGGERQRIAIARVVLKDPRILVLDEATSHLDSISESLIQEALQTVMKDRTNLVIAHRLSTVKSADKILVMNEGRLVESGSHQELVQKNGLYKELYVTQFQPSPTPQDEARPIAAD
jgi:ATP-binding cassette subfamily B protein